MQYTDPTEFSPEELLRMEVEYQRRLRIRTGRQVISAGWILVVVAIACLALMWIALLPFGK